MCQKAEINVTALRNVPYLWIPVSLVPEGPADTPVQFIRPIRGRFISPFLSPLPRQTKTLTHR